jgi:hypothetical protein
MKSINKAEVKRWIYSFLWFFVLLLLTQSLLEYYFVEEKALAFSKILLQKAGSSLMISAILTVFQYWALKRRSSK